MVRRRFAHGSSTGAQRIQVAATETIAAHHRVREAAAQVSTKLDELSSGIPVECVDDDDDSMVCVIETAQRAVAPPN